MALLVSVDEDDPRPLYEQLVATVKDQLRKGLLAPGEELPSFRELAAELGVNMHTVRHAYKQLEREGVLVVRLGRRARIASCPRQAASPEQVDGVLGPIIAKLVNEAWRLGLSADELTKRVGRAMKATRKGGTR